MNEKIPPVEASVERPPKAKELWISASETFPEEELSRMVQEQEFTTTVRLGDRTPNSEDPKGAYHPGHFVAFRIKRPDGTFAQDIPVVITETRLEQIATMPEEALTNDPVDGDTKEKLIVRLEGAYNKTIAPTDIVTIVNFENADGLASVEDLLRTHVLARAEAPLDNPKDIEFDCYTVPLIEHDYPAKTPVMWNAAYKAFGIDAGNIMLVGDPTSGEHILSALKKDEHYIGGGAGVGFKDAVVEHLDELDETAIEAGSVNFILKTEAGQLRGFNTDGLGFAEGLEDLFSQNDESLTGKRMIILGSGGTGNAVASALAGKGARLTIINRTVEKAQQLAKKMNERYGVDTATADSEDSIATHVQTADAIINVSTKGSKGALEGYSALAPASLPANPENLEANLKSAQEIFEMIPKNAIVADVVLAGKPTPLIAEAHARGLRTMDGIPMVINQGVKAFMILHGDELAEKGFTEDDVKRVMNEAASRA
ncbi:MAG: shikimate dehydrogenase [Candidatus Parcubacteria bacterium]|jgi:shikimate dehydrogenase